MIDRIKRAWDAIIGSDQSTTPRWIATPILFVYLTIQEFSRNRCPEKASALGFQTVFSLIPALVLTLVIFQPFGSSSEISSNVSRVLFRILNLEDGEPVGAEPDAEKSQPQSNPTEKNESADEQQENSNTPTAAGTASNMPNGSETSTTDSVAKAGANSEEAASEDEEQDSDSAEGQESPPGDDTTKNLADTTTEESEGDPETPDTDGNVPVEQRDQASESYSHIRSNIDDLVKEVYGKFQDGGLKIPSFALLILSALMLGLTLENSLDEIWGSPVRRRFLQRVAVYWGVFTLGPLLIGLSLYGADQVERRLPFATSLEDYVIELLGPVVALYLIYQLMPMAPVRPISAFGGALLGAVAWKFADQLFRLYLNTVVGPERFYGNLGLIPLFLLVVWTFWMLLLVGAVVAYALQNYQYLLTEERRRRGSPFVQPGLVALGLVLLAARAFTRQDGPVTAKQIGKLTRMPDKLWMSLVGLLCDRGILIRTGPDESGFMPGRPLDNLFVEDVFEAIEDSQVIPVGRNRELQPLQQVADAIVKSRRDELEGKTIADLIENERK